MSTKDLQEKYGKSSSKAALNAAIRAELPGGGEALDALEIAHKAIGGVARGEEHYGAMSRTLDAARAVVAAMEAEIRRRYGMPAL